MRQKSQRSQDTQKSQNLQESNVDSSKSTRDKSKNESYAVSISPVDTMKQSI